MARKTGRSTRLQLYDNGNVECPICLTPFTREEANAGRIVTLEHVPPKFISGRARCLTCKKCNAGTGRDIDQIAAITRQPTKVTVDILGKRDSFYLSDEGKELTPAFGGFSKRDFRSLRNSKTGNFTMSLRIPNREAVATSWLKAAYLAMFSLLGSSEGYHYVHSELLAAVRKQILDPLNQGVAGKYVIDSTENMPDRDILLMSEPVPCWMIKIENRTVVLPCNWEEASNEPLAELRRYSDGRPVSCRGEASWMFQTFGTFRSIRVHLEGADRMESLVGLTIRGNLPSGKLVEGTCIRHMGESATLLLADRKLT